MLSRACLCKQRSVPVYHDCHYGPDPRAEARVSQDPRLKPPGNRYRPFSHDKDILGMQNHYVTRNGLYQIGTRGVGCLWQQFSWQCEFEVFWPIFICCGFWTIVSFYYKSCEILRSHTEQLKKYLCYTRYKMHEAVSCKENRHLHDYVTTVCCGKLNNCIHSYLGLLNAKTVSMTQCWQ